MKIGEIVQRVQSLYSKGAASDDSRLSSRHIYNHMLTTRARLISQEANKKQRISAWNYQTIPCIEMEVVPAHECPCLPAIGCDVLKSKYELPKPLHGLSEDLIKSVTSIERSIKIDSITINAVNAQRGNKYTSKKSNYFIRDGYLYLTTYTEMSVLSIVGLFEDPVEVEEFIGYCDETCTGCRGCKDYPEEEFPIDVSMIDQLIQLTSQELLNIFPQSIEDKVNDSQDKTQQQPRKR